MSFKQIIIRGVANTIFFLKKREFKKSGLKFLVFTGTVGKTTLRDAVVYALENLKIPVFSNRLGYSNELGIILTALDFSIKSPIDWFKLLFKKVPKEGFVCIEIGADFYTDIGWFLEKFIPHSVFISGVAKESWSRDIKEVFQDRKNLLENVPKNGFIIYNIDDAEINKLVQESKISGKKVGFSRTYEEKYNLLFKKSIFEPQIYAVLATFVFIQELFPNLISKLSPLFESYEFSQLRLQTFKAKNGAMIVEDIYKATPLDTEWFLDNFKNFNAKKVILVITEMRPLSINLDYFYTRLVEKMKGINQVYFLGPDKCFALLNGGDSKIKKIGINNYKDIAREMLDGSSTGDLILLKGSCRYRLEELRDMLI